MGIGNQENLRVLTTEEARLIGKKGGLASVKKRREKKVLSQIFGDILQETFNVKFENGEKVKLSSKDYIKSIMQKVLQRGDNSTVALLKLIAENTEGTKHTHNVFNRDFLIVGDSETNDN